MNPNSDVSKQYLGKYVNSGTNIVGRNNEVGDFFDQMFISLALKRCYDPALFNLTVSSFKSGALYNTHINTSFYGTYDKYPVNGTGMSKSNLKFLYPLIH